VRSDHPTFWILTLENGDWYVYPNGVSFMASFGVEIKPVLVLVIVMHLIVASPGSILDENPSGSPGKE
jgi:hypothetical protein